MDHDRRILVVDDDRTNRMMLAYRLEADEYTVDTAENGNEALDKLRNRRFELVLLDVLMPDLDGYETLKLMKDDIDLQDVPVVMMSALGEMDSVVRCLEMGAEDYLPKPLNAVLLSSRINGILLRGEIEKVKGSYDSVISMIADVAESAVAGDDPPATIDGIAERPDAAGRLARGVMRLADIVSKR